MVPEITIQAIIRWKEGSIACNTHLIRYANERAEIETIQKFSQLLYIRRVEITYFEKFPVRARVLTFFNTGKFNVAPAKLPTYIESKFCKLAIDTDVNAGAAAKTTFSPTEIKLSAATEVRSGVFGDVSKS